MTLDNRPIVVGLGEVLWDCFADLRRPGGAPANVAFGAQQLGCQGAVCSRVGRDQLGDELCQFLRDQQLDVSCVQHDSEFPTGTVTVDTSEARHPSFTIHQHVAWDQLEFTAELESMMQRASAVCFGTLAQRSPTSRITIYRCLQTVGNHCLKVYDVNLRQDWYRIEWIEESLTAADIVKLNDDEAALISELLEVASESNGHQPLARAFESRFGVRLTCITRGHRGCVLYAQDQQAVAEGIPIQVKDTVGAGDAFTAALIYSRLHRWPLAASAEFANRVGALIASQQGAMPAVQEEFRSLIDCYKPAQPG